MPPEFDLAPVADLPRQRSFLQAVLPILAALESIEAIWLSGSLARRDADSWSSVDCCLLWRAAPLDASDAARRRESMRDALRHALGDGNYLLDRCPQRHFVASLQGITLAQNLPAGTRGQRVEAGVTFAFLWADSTTASELRSRTGPIHPLYLSTRLSGELRYWLKEKVDRLSPPNAEIVGAQLDRFWLVLARLPAVLKRRENLAAHALLGELRSLLIDLVVALNGASRPHSAARINQYLGAVQREAFEKSLGYGQSPSGSRALNATWIGQAVALIVLYRWYAPQLVETYATPYPQLAEETVLDLLRTQIDGWPAEITTG